MSTFPRLITFFWTIFPEDEGALDGDMGGIYTGVPTVADPMNAAHLPARDIAQWAGGSPPRHLRVSQSL